MTISEIVRKRVTARARNCCEYCRILAEFVHAPMEIDHIQPLAKGGGDNEANLCLACPRCNRAKQALTEAVDPLSGETAPLYNPRTEIWLDHFRWDDDRATIIGLTASGRASVLALSLNRQANLNFRLFLVSIGAYPPKD